LRGLTCHHKPQRVCEPTTKCLQGDEDGHVAEERHPHVALENQPAGAPGGWGGWGVSDGHDMPLLPMHAHHVYTHARTHARTHAHTQEASTHNIFLRRRARARAAGAGALSEVAVCVCVPVSTLTPTHARTHTCAHTPSVLSLTHTCVHAHRSGACRWWRRWCSSSSRASRKALLSWPRWCRWVSEASGFWL
jgi:hypothetical protein